MPTKMLRNKLNETLEKFSTVKLIRHLYRKLKKTFHIHVLEELILVL